MKQKEILKKPHTASEHVLSETGIIALVELRCIFMGPDQQDQDYTENQQSVLGLQILLSLIFLI